MNSCCCITEIARLIVILLYLLCMILPYLFADFIIKFTLITLVAYTNESLVKTIVYF